MVATRSATAYFSCSDEPSHSDAQSRDHEGALFRKRLGKGGERPPEHPEPRPRGRTECDPRSSTRRRARFAELGPRMRTRRGQNCTNTREG